MEYQSSGAIQKVEITAGLELEFHDKDYKAEAKYDYYNAAGKLEKELSVSPAKIRSAEIWPGRVDLECARREAFAIQPTSDETCTDCVHHGR